MERVATEIHGSAADGGLANDGVRVVRGTPSFNRSQLDVEGDAVATALIVIATGTSRSIPPLPGLAEAMPLTNRTVFKMRELPRRLAVLGGGPIGLELGQAFAMLGGEWWWSCGQSFQGRIKSVRCGVGVPITSRRYRNRG